MTTSSQLRTGLTVLCWTVIFGLASSLAAQASTQCPSSKTIQAGFQKVFKRGVDVLKIEPSAIPGMCQITVSISGRKGVFYSDPTGDYFLTGQVWDVAKAKNLTQEVMMNLNRLKPEEMKELEKLTAFTYGTAGPTIYFASDPQCGYCKRALKVIKKLVAERKLTVKFLLYPLSIHKDAAKECVSILCDQKGLKGLEEGYQSDNQCAEGKQKVAATEAFLKARGITGTPVYIFPDGFYHMGLLPENVLLKRLGEETSGPAQKPSGSAQDSKNKGKN